MAAMGAPPQGTVIVLGFVAVAAATAVIGVPPEDEGITLTFAVTVAVAATFLGGKVGVCAIIGVAWSEWGCDNLCK